MNYILEQRKYVYEYIVYISCKYVYAYLMYTSVEFTLKGKEPITNSFQ